MTQYNPSHSVPPTRRVNWRLAAAIAAVPLLAALPTRTARAQFPVQNNGHANDANNQIGSGGYNNSVQRGGGVNNNNIIYNNVTRGQGFTGHLQETDALSFRGRLPGYGTDRFTAQSNPAAVRATPSANTVVPTVQPFYGDTRFVTPPGFVQTLNNSGYVPAGTNQASSYTPNLLPNGTTGGSFQTGAGTSTTTTGGLTPVFGNGTYAPYGLDTVRVGPTDAGSQQTLLVVSPGFGIQQAPLDNAAGDYFSSRTTTRSPLGFDRFQRLTPDQMRAIEDELERVQPSNQRSGTNPPAQNPQSPNAPNPNGPNPPGPNGQPAPALDQLGRPLPQPLETPANGALNNPALGSSLNTQALGGAGLKTGEGAPRPLISPGEQTPVYRTLQNTMDTLYPDRPQTVTQRPVPPARPLGGTAATTTPPGLPGVPGTTGAVGTSTTARPPGTGALGNGRPPGLTGNTGSPRTPSAIAPGAAGAGGDTSGAATLAGGTRSAPVHVTSLATGVKAPKFADLLRSAEDLMKQGKYTSAVQQYATAEVVAPNNPLIPVGEAIAELGQESYRNAEQILRRSFADPALLHAQFDLNAFLGEKRVGEITNDLKSLAVKEPKSEAPSFLLAFVAYNTGHEADAAKYLNDAEAREGRADPVIQRMRQHWNLAPAASRTPTAPSAPSAPAAPSTPAKPAGGTPNLNK